MRRVRDALASRPGLVEAPDVRTLRTHLSAVASGEAQVLQAGDCAEDPDECTPEHIARKTALLDLLAGTMKLNTRKPVVKVGRIAGQFAKPRSMPTELVNGVELPTYRGHMVNSPEPTREQRCPDPLRLVTGYMAAGDIMEHLGWRKAPRRTAGDPSVWTSHEALLLAYEAPMVRTDEVGRPFLSSTHWPWIGERTRQVDGAHVALLSRMANPVACKVGSRMTEDELLSLCESLDPNREPGRLTLIARLGSAVVSERLPHLVAAVREAGHPAIWLVDPMHGNTVTTSSGHKTRHVASVVDEIQLGKHAIERAGGTAGGLHLETTPDAVTECVRDSSEHERVGDR